MAQRQDEILGKGVHQPEGDFIMMVHPVHRVTRHIRQRVVHEAHVPFEPEAQIGARFALMRGQSDARPSRAFFRQRHDPGGGGIKGAVHRAEEFGRLPILASAVAIGDPFARLTAVITVEHRGDGIHAQPIDMIALSPEQRIVDEEGRNLPPPEIIDGGVPIGVEAKLRVGMFIQRCAIEMGKAMVVRREVGGHPINQDG